MQIDRAFEPLFGWFAARGLLGPPRARSASTTTIRSRSPRTTCARAPASWWTTRFRFEPPLIETIIPGGRHAVLRHKGPYATMRSAYQWFFGAWLTQSGEEVADAPVFEEYLNNPREIAPAELLTDIYLPLK